MMATLGPGFTWFFALLILGESLNWVGIAAMLLTIASLLLLINNNTEREEVRTEGFGGPLKACAAAFAGAAFTGLAFILAKKTVLETGRIISEFQATWIRILLAFGAILLFDAARGRHPLL